jgi:NAD(P)H-hydrate epimerase
MADRAERVTVVPPLPPRPRDAHKGDFGRVLVVGGSRGMIGAVALAANAALRGGAGLVTFAASETVQRTVAALCPCATSVPLAADPASSADDLAPAAVGQMLAAAERADVVAVGCGLGVGTTRQNLIRAALRQARPAVIDADGLNNLAKIIDWPSLRNCPLVLTPHPGEFARLTGSRTADVQADREAAALAAVRRWAGRGGADRDAGAPAGGDARAGGRGRAEPDDGPHRPLVCVLKGAGTVVTDGRRTYINDTGNPGMATGGTGDVLTGLTAAMIAQGLAPFEASCLAVRVHGRAGDLAAQRLGQPALIASDLLDHLPAAIQEFASGEGPRP